MFAVDRHLILVAGEAVKFVNENIIERFFVAVFKHLLERFAVVVGACRRTVDIGADNDNAISLREFSAYPYLTFN